MAKDWLELTVLVVDVIIIVAVLVVVVVACVAMTAAAAATEMEFILSIDEMALVWVEPDQALYFSSSIRILSSRDSRLGEDSGDLSVSSSEELSSPPTFRFTSLVATITSS